ncbi:MAG: heme-binding domain-containing protein [Algoriphagus sp.]|nr:heme-binding domain-containing protein [Algoriphagus sp.]
MKRWNYLLGGLALVFLGSQLVPNELPAVESTNPGDIIASGTVPDDVASLLKKSCYNCHSNETEYPWYSHVAPSSWLVARDIRAAREELNFSMWQDFDMMDKLGKLDDISIEVGEGRMPLTIYTMVHPSAKLDDAQRQLIVAWAEATMDVVAEEEDEESEVDEQE